MPLYSNIFSKLDTSFQLKVRLGNDDLEVKGKGNVIVETRECIRYIHNILFVPNLAQNHLSVG